MVDQGPSRWRQLVRRLTVVALVAVIGLLPLGSTSAVNNLNRKWISLPNGCFDHWVRFNYFANVPGGAFKNRISDGRSLWNNVDRELFFAKDVSNIRVWIAFEQPGWPNENVLGLTNLNAWPWWEVHNGTIQFNPIYTWYTNVALPIPAQPEQYDLWTVAAHEFGHLVSLNHGNANDVMRPAFAPAQADRTLSVHDKDGLRHYYPALAC